LQRKFSSEQHKLKLDRHTAVNAMNEDFSRKGIAVLGNMNLCIRPFSF